MVNLTNFPMPARHDSWEHATANPKATCSSAECYICVMYAHYDALSARLQACQSNDDSPLTDDVITQNERFLLDENERLRTERDGWFQGYKAHVEMARRERVVADQLAEALRLVANTWGVREHVRRLEHAPVADALATYDAARKENK